MVQMSSEAKGKRRLVTVAWRSAAEAAIDDAKRSRREIAEAAGTSGPYLSMLLAGRYQSSTFLDAISAELGILTSDPSYGTPTIQELASAVAELPDDMAEHVLNIVKTMLAANKQTKH